MSTKRWQDCMMLVFGILIGVDAIWALAARATLVAAGDLTR